MEDRRHPRRATNDSAGSGALRRPGGDPSGSPAGHRRAPLPTRVEDVPALPRAYDAALRAGLRTLGIALQAGQREAIDAHVRLLLAWNEAVNLTAIVDPAQVATRHVLDSLAAVVLLRARGANSLIDLGSGGGFPGLPLAVAVPLHRTLLVESVAKKARFLDVAANAAGLSGRVLVVPERAEAIAARPEHRGGWPVATARAVGSLAEIIELAFPLLAPGGCLVAWKRGDLAAELAAAERAVTGLGGGSIETLPVGLPDLPGHCLVVASPRGPVPARFPREPAVRQRRPW